MKQHLYLLDTGGDDEALKKLNIVDSFVFFHILALDEFKNAWNIFKNERLYSWWCICTGYCACMLIRKPSFNVEEKME